MEITAELRTLAKFTAGPLPVISVYLNTQWRDQPQRARTTTFFERHLHQAQALEPETETARQSLAHDLERLTHWGQQHLQSPGESAMPGVALFACAGADLWVECPSPCHLKTNGPLLTVLCYASSRVSMRTTRMPSWC